MKDFPWNQQPRGENGHKPGAYSEVTPTPPSIPALTPAVGAHHVDRQWLMDGEWPVDCDLCETGWVYGSPARAEAERILHNRAWHQPHTQPL